MTPSATVKKIIRLVSTSLLTSPESQYENAIPPKPPDPTAEVMRHRLSSAVDSPASVSPLLLPAKLMTYPARALIDSGSSGNFIRQQFVRQHGIRTVPTDNT